MPDHLHHHTSRWPRGVDRQAAELGFDVSQPFYDRQDILD
jgi:hypothetical protein